MKIKNPNNLPVGFTVEKWNKCPVPDFKIIEGRYCYLERFDLDKHSQELWLAHKEDLSNANWTYLPYGPFNDLTEYQEWLAEFYLGSDPLCYTVIERQNNQAVGLLTYLRIEPKIGSIEIGHIHFCPALQRTTAATEAIYLIIDSAFRCGYRRLEWKCDNLNASSKRAATRFGFSHEGIFRQATMYKNRNRDTAWFSIIDREWPQLKLSFKQWLSHKNFDSQGQQKKSLQDIRKNEKH